MSGGDCEARTSGRPRCAIGINLSAGTLPITGRLQGQTGGRAESLNIPLGRLAEEAVVFAIEVAGAFVSNLKSRSCGINIIHEHALSCGMQPELLLILKRAHSGELPEMPV